MLVPTSRDCGSDALRAGRTGEASRRAGPGWAGVGGGSSRTPWGRKSAEKVLDT